MIPFYIVANAALELLIIRDYCSSAGAQESVGSS
jgi:hypothetical protein